MKAYGIDINPRMIQYNAAIRQKGDVARLLVNIVRFLNVLGIPPQLDSLTKNWSEDYIRLILYIEKMSRVFICERDKIHTFQFPFQIIIEEDHCVVLFEGEHITSSTCSILSSVFEELSEDESLEAVLEKYWEIVSDLEIGMQDNKMCGKLITFLLSFEAGYLRFDMDELNANGKMHPKEHLDINYSTGCTFKLGLSKGLNYSELIDILNINTACHYLQNA